ncbi:MAG: signal peptide peptidase SppA [Alphaproteobacteria bacterium]|jgi:protease IV|nr:signal peptide peptidase SppA [Alphaproteobacteria bacterium]MBT4711352.1 signal peptide peptidase SppA [Alphaproteobacteria bacterium]
MTLDADAIVDRRRTKRQLVVWRLATILAFLGIAAILTVQSGALAPRSYVAQVNISGVMVGDPLLMEDLAVVAQDPDIQALIVHIDSPGGTVVAGEELYLAIRDIAETKPVVAVIGNMGTSAGYLVALGADYIIARRSSVTGSIGVLIQTADVTQFLELLGISAETIKSSPLKATPSPLEPLTPEARAATQAVVDDMYRWFVDLLTERRELTPLEALQLADGRVFTGRQAIANNLVDAIGGVEEARDWLQTTRGIDRDLPTVQMDRERHVSLGVSLLSLGRKTLLPETLRLDGLVSVWHPDALN